LQDFESVLTKIELNPKIYVPVFDNFRKANLSIFSYSMYYEYFEDYNTVEIFAIVHTSRNPSIIKRRIKKRLK